MKLAQAKGRLSMAYDLCTLGAAPNPEYSGVNADAGGIANGMKASIQIVPDAGLVLAVERGATGASIHKLQNLLQVYQLACYTGNQHSVRTTELQLLRALQKSACQPLQ